MESRTEHARLHVEAGRSDHVSDHEAIANHLNGHRACPTCLAIVDDQDADAHRRTHVGRAIAAR